MGLFWIFSDMSQHMGVGVCVVEFEMLQHRAFPTKKEGSEVADGVWGNQKLDGKAGHAMGLIYCHQLSEKLTDGGVHWYCLWRMKLASLQKYEY